MKVGNIELDSRSELKTESMIQCLEYSFKNLDESTKKFLFLLLPFTNYINCLFLSGYVSQLSKRGLIKEDEEDIFRVAIRQASEWGLLHSTNSDNTETLNIHPILPYFLRSKKNEMDMSSQYALFNAFREHYQRIANLLLQYLGNQNNDLNRFLLVCNTEYENLMFALEICLEEPDNINIFYCLCEYFDHSGQRQAIIRLTTYVYQKLQKIDLSGSSQQLARQVAGVIDGFALALLKNGLYEPAKLKYQEYLNFYLKNVNPSREEECRTKAHVYLHLGRIEAELGRHRTATRNYRYSRFILRGYSQNPSTNSTLAGIHLQLGISYLETVKYSNAHSSFQEAFQIFNIGNNLDGKAKALHGLGQTSQTSGKHLDARLYYTESIKIRRNDHEQARTYLQLASLEKDIGNINAAKQAAKKALEIFILYLDYSGQAITYSLFAQIATVEKDYESFESYALKATSIAAAYPCSSNVLKKILSFLDDSNIKGYQFADKFFEIIQGESSNIKIFKCLDGYLHVAWGNPDKKLIPLGAILLTSALLLQSGSSILLPIPLEQSMETL